MGVAFPEGDSRCHRATVPGVRRGTRPGQRTASRPYARLCSRAGRRKGTGAESPRSSGTGEARGWRSLGPGAQAGSAGGHWPDRGLQPAPGSDLAYVSRYRRPSPQAHQQGRHWNLRRSALRRRQNQRPHHRGSGRVGNHSTARSTCPTRPSRSTSALSAAPPRIPKAMSPWSARR